MSDNFGKPQYGSVSDGSRFDATPAADVPAGGIFMPAYSTSPFFGIAERPVKSGTLGAFARTGVFAFAPPNGFTSSAGQAIYYKPTSAVAGTLSASSSTGAVRIGYEVVPPGNDGRLCVCVAPGDALVPASD